MNRSLNNPFVQFGLLLAAFALGTLLSFSVPNPYVASGGGPGGIDQRSPAPLDAAAAIFESYDQANTSLGVDVDPKHMEYVSRIG